MSHAPSGSIETGALFDRLKERACPICGSSTARASLFLDSNADTTRLSATSFASRKEPEYMSYRLLRCNECQTIYAAAIPETEQLTGAYSHADYDSAEEAALAAETYARALAPVIRAGPQNGRALEIGTGTGVLLSKLLAAGFAEAVGIEPSRAAIAAAEPSVRGFIREGVFTESNYVPESFDLICCFQTLEHVPEPRHLVQSCSRLLRPGGTLALVTHDYRALVNRMLGRRSPIIDVEHLQLFCKPSLRRLLEDSALNVTVMRTLSNRYPLRYWLRLAPLPVPVKRATERLLAASGLGRVRLGVNVGNLFVAAKKST